MDEKVRKLEEAYKNATEGSNPFIQSEEKQRERTMKKFFPGKDIPLGGKRQQSEDHELEL